MNKPKIIAFYLPQFHAIPENDKWWGKGFTEWTNTRKSQPLYTDHYQPREPYEDNYYCLLDSHVQEWQSEVAQKYGIYGFCYYHYWFNGKLLIEKPMENMLKNKKITIPFCISWANEPWTRNWDGREKEVLMPQEYGGEKEWEEHLQYLLPFFQDSRYIKKENKPIMLLYRTVSINSCNEMVQYWNKRLKDYGFDGIYIIETLTGHQAKSVLNISDAVVEMEPMHTIRHHLPIIKQVQRLLVKKLNKRGFNLYDKISYDMVWKNILKKVHSNHKKHYLGAFMDWDNSPRWGRRAMIIKGTSVEKFKCYFSKQYHAAEKLDSEFIFFNAWNEWAEGTYLEPDKKYKYEFLEAIKSIVNETYE